MSGGATKWEVEPSELLPLQKGEAEKVSAMLKGGLKKFCDFERSHYSDQ